MKNLVEVKIEEATKHEEVKPQEPEAKPKPQPQPNQNVSGLDYYPTSFEVQTTKAEAEIKVSRLIDLKMLDALNTMESIQKSIIPVKKVSIGDKKRMFIESFEVPDDYRSLGKVIEWSRSSPLTDE